MLNSDYHLRHTSWITFLLYIFLPFYVLQNKSHYSWFYSSVFHASFCHKMTNSLRRRSLHLSPLYVRWFECPWRLVFSELKAMFLPDHADNCEQILCAFKLVKFFFHVIGHLLDIKLFLKTISLRNPAPLIYDRTHPVKLLWCPNRLFMFCRCKSLEQVFFALLPCFVCYLVQAALEDLVGLPDNGCCLDSPCLLGEW